MVSANDMEAETGINQTINEQRKLTLQRGMLLGSASVFLRFKKFY